MLSSRNRTTLPWSVALLACSACAGTSTAPAEHAEAVTPMPAAPSVATTARAPVAPAVVDPASVPLCIETITVTWEGTRVNGRREPSRADAQALAETLRARLAAGEAFSSVRDAAGPEQFRFPTCSGRWSSAVSAVAGTLAPGSVHDAVIDEGEALVLLRRLAGDEVLQARHILVRIGPTFHTREEAFVLAREIRLRAVQPGADFGAIARELSEEPGGRERGGDFGPFTRGMTVEPFERAVLELRPGEVSDVVETPFGLHVIQRLR